MGRLGKRIRINTYYKPLEIRLSLLNHNSILKRSSGEVTNANTINQTTYEPIKGGLFCNTIFKNNKANHCICTVCSFRQDGLYRCNRCGGNTRIDKSNIQNLSIGHIELVSPIPHPWFLQTKIIHILCEGMEGIYEYKELTRIINFNPERVYYLFKNMDLLTIYYTLRTHLVHSLMNSTHIATLEIQNGAYNNIIHNMLPTKIRIITSLLRLKQRPEWMFLKVLPVLSPTYRPLMKVNDRLSIASDINYSYQKIIERNNSFKELLKIYNININTKRYNDLITNADLKKDNPLINAQVQLQKTVMELIDPSVLKKNSKIDQSIIKRLTGKEGRFRKDILGKRINFTGRTVITSGPRLQMNQCGLPIELIIELFKPFLLLMIRDYNKMFRNNLNIKRSVSTKLIYKLINDIVCRHPILLNRAPTLHKMNIQAFTPLLIHTKTVQLHPLVCSSFNADFDGDTMAIYVPHTIRSQIEARILMMTSTNIISPSAYEPIIIPSQDIVFGLYYLTTMYEGAIGENSLIRNIKQMQQMLDFGHLKIHSMIRYVNASNITTITTPGRLLLYFIVSEYCNNIEYAKFNILFDKKEIVSLLKDIYYKYGFNKISIVLDHIMNIGFYYAYKAGISLHKNDINVPNLKELFVKRTQSKVDLDSRQFARGVMTSDEKSKRLLSEWSKCAAMLANQIYKDIVYTLPINKSSIYMLIHSGARGSMVQMRQLCGIRGLMMKPSGDIVEIPIVSNFKEGLSILDYFNSTHGARKGVIDTSLKTAVAGYLTRKLFYASKDVLVIENDCGTKKGIIFGDLRYTFFGTKTRIFYRDLIGRYTARKCVNPVTGKILLNRDVLVTSKVLEKLRHFKIEFLFVRSPITCESKNGICSKCYGSSSDNLNMIPIGDSIGIVAAQSIGEPGTQLTMRTFHLGGTVLKGSSEHSVISTGKGRIFYMNYKVLISDTINRSEIVTQCKIINVSRQSKLIVVDKDYSILSSFAVPYGATLYVHDGEEVNINKLLFEWDPFAVPIVCLQQGIVSFKKKDLSNLVTRNSTTGFNDIIYLKNTHALYLRWYLTKTNTKVEYSIMPGDTLNIFNNSYVKKGDIIGRINTSQGITQDITGGLSKISKLFECVQTQSSLISSAEGYIMLSYEESTSKLIVYVHTYSRKYKKWKLVRIGTLKEPIQLNVREHDYVYKGDVINDGIVPIRDCAEKLNFQTSFYHLVEQIQSTYLDNGVMIHQKHIEVIASQMYSKVVHILDNRDENEMQQKTSTCYKKQLKSKIKVLRYNKDYHNSCAVGNLVIGILPKKAKISLAGISNVSFLSTSFLSSASFQKTSKILTEASFWRGSDSLTGAQANLFFGYIIPIGTGSIHSCRHSYLKYYYKNNIII